MSDGSQRARELLERSGLRFHALLAKITLREDAADDLLQELFLKLNRSHAFRFAKNAEAYAHRAAVRLAFDWRRNQERRTTVELAECDVPDRGPSPAAQLADQEEFQRVLAAMGRLSTIAQQVLTMRFLEGCTYEEIGMALGRTTHQSRSICHKAIARLRVVIDPGFVSADTRKSPNA